MSADDPIEKAVDERAAQWWLRNREGALTAGEKVEFAAWLQASPQHVAAYLALASSEKDLRDASRVWVSRHGAVPATTAAPPSVVPLPLASAADAPRRGARRSMRPGLRIALALAASLAAAVIGSWVLRDGQRFGLPKTYSTAHAEQGSYPLPDGSMLHLNSDSRAVVRFDDRERLVVVEHGQAMFQVAKDAARRFRVDAGNAQIVAVGTEFDVYRQAAGTRVVVLEGRVAVLRSVPPVSAPALNLPGATALSAGEQLVVDARRSPTVQPADLRRARAWTQREVVFKSAPLSEVVADFNRYSTVPIEIDDEQLKALEITGVFGAYDVESFVEFLRRLEGVRVDETRARIRILSMPPRDPRAPVTVEQGGSDTPGTTAAAGG